MVSLGPNELICFELRSFGSNCFKDSKQEIGEFDKNGIKDTELDLVGTSHFIHYSDVAWSSWHL